MSLKSVHSLLENLKDLLSLNPHLFEHIDIVFITSLLYVVDQLIKVVEMIGCHLFLMK